mmetsp:Transcript_31396/g.93945  ORF Transcript_31396/g.93945 Transcript_31396/m.93945 type:complete len:91 (+) Transcript_31396:124-396(+)
MSSMRPKCYNGLPISRSQMICERLNGSACAKELTVHLHCVDKVAEDKTNHCHVVNPYDGCLDEKAAVCINTNYDEDRKTNQKDLHVGQNC